MMQKILCLFLWVRSVNAAELCTDCNLVDMSEASYIVSPSSGDTSCLFSSTKIPNVDDEGAFMGFITPLPQGFTFQVFPGSNEKFVIVFRGGSPLTYTDSVLSTFVDALTTGGVGESVSVVPFPIADDAGGVYSRDGFEGNPYSDYTVVSISQCTGDLHLGDTEATFDTAGILGFPLSVSYKGKNNAHSAFDWIDRNKADGGIKDLVIHGTSSGSVAAIVYAHELFEKFSPKGIKRVVTDGNPALATSDNKCQSFLTNTQALNKVNGCDVLPKDDLVDKCHKFEAIDTKDVLKKAIEINDDDVLFLEIASKQDGNIITSLSLLGLVAVGDLILPEDLKFDDDSDIFSDLFINEYCKDYISSISEDGIQFNDNPLFFTELEYYKSINKIIEKAADENDNYRAFLVNTIGHEMMDAQVQEIDIGIMLPAGTNITGIGTLPFRIYEGAINPTLTTDFSPDGDYESPFRDIKACGLEGDCSFSFLPLYDWLNKTLVPVTDFEYWRNFLCNECFERQSDDIEGLDDCEKDFVKFSNCIELNDFFPSS
uniref:Fungal lipase-like domain-containing protein n=1 Tax=Aureoumbra lagunensis TaxID=44058 RepID=A0A7S3NF60_9STRA|mmetsp:Transcript_7355/g.9316  ORF Transcript_7355/g.9316 Transcript_7355/m.9316 type:complete len:542 (+) Transcript_7355:74-1699(+)